MAAARPPSSPLPPAIVNWISATVPGAGDTAAIDAAGSYTVTTSASETVASLDTVAGARLAIGNSVFTDIDGTGLGANAGTVDQPASATACWPFPSRPL
jgi:hypothetical protein